MNGSIVVKRRDFIKKTALYGGIAAGSEFFASAVPEEAAALGTGGGIDISEALYFIESMKKKNLIPEIRPEIRNNPQAVFLVETHVREPRDKRGFFTGAQPELEAIGKDIANAIFVRGTRKGGSTLVKPNFTTVPDSVFSPVVGIITSPDFIAGFINGLRDMGNVNVMVGERGSNVRVHRKTGIYSVFDRHNISLIEATYRSFPDYTKKELNWHRVTHPVVWRNIPTYRPIGDRDTVFINMAKLKAHNLGLTSLTIKNLQGAVPIGYGQYCNSWSELPFLAKRGVRYPWDFVQFYQEYVESAFLKHRAQGYKYWDYEGYYDEYVARGGWKAFRKIRKDEKAVREFMDGIERVMWDEQWCQRALDSATAIKPTINIIEGVIGRDGSGFEIGTDELCNIVIVGLSMVEVDSIGSWIIGHDPRELYYTRIAKERGLGENDPSKIKMYWIRKGEIIPVVDLSEIKRYRLGVNLHNRIIDFGNRLVW